jgi:hypothetical protein
LQFSPSYNAYKESTHEARDETSEGTHYISAGPDPLKSYSEGVIGPWIETHAFYGGEETYSLAVKEVG